MESYIKVGMRETVEKPDKKWKEYTAELCIPQKRITPKEIKKRMAMLRKELNYQKKIDGIN